LKNHKGKHHLLSPFGKGGERGILKTSKAFGATIYNFQRNKCGDFEHLITL